MSTWQLRFGTLVILNAAAWCMFGAYGATSAAPDPQAPTRQPPISTRQPFKNSVEQRQQMVTELREIKALLQTQNKILKEISAK